MEPVKTSRRRRPRIVGPIEEAYTGPSMEEMEANDPHLLKSTAESIGRIVHSDGSLPKGLDNVTALISMAFNGESLLVRRAAILEMGAFLRRQAVYIGRYAQTVHEYSHAISDKAQDFPEAEKLGAAVKEIFVNNFNGLGAAMNTVSNMAYVDDAAEALGINEYVRTQVINSIPSIRNNFGEIKPDDFITQ